jgi:hypothetical protein
MEPELRDSRWRRRFVDDQTHTLGGDSGETTELFMADDLAGGDRAPLIAIQYLHVVLLHTLAPGDVLLKARDVEALGSAEVELDRTGGYGYAPYSSAASL